MSDLDLEPTQPEFVQWRKDVLAQQNKGTGRKVWTPGQFNQAIGSTPDGRTQRQLNEEMRLFLMGAPKATPGQGIVITAGNLDGQWRGYAEGDGGLISESDYRGMTVTRVAAGFGPNGGDVEIALGVVDDEKVAQDFFRQVTVDGVTLQSADATYDEPNQTWTWASTGVSFSNNQDYSVVFRHDPPPSDTVVTFTAEDAGDGFTGYVANGRELRHQGVLIDRFVTNASLQGILVMDLELGTLPLPQDLFDSVLMNGWELFSRDATFDADMQTWVWTNTGFDFVAGQLYTVTVRG